MDRRNIIVPVEQANWPIVRSKSFWTTIIILLLLLLRLIWQGLWGTIYYHVEYVRAALGNDAVGSACARVRAAENPWDVLDRGGWWTLQRCLGNEDGFRRQGELLGLGRDAFAQFTRALGPVPTLTAVGTAFWYLVTYGPEHVERLVGAIKRIPQDVLARVVFGVSTLGLGVAWLFFPFDQFLKTAIALTIPALALFGYHFFTETPSRAWQDIKALLGPVIDFIVLGASQTSSILRPIKNLLTSPYRLFPSRSCRHIRNCDCPRREEVDNLNEALANAQNEVNHQNEINYHLRQRTIEQADELNILQNRPGNRANLHRRMGMDGNTLPLFPQSPQSPRSRDLQREVENLQDVIEQLQRHHSVQERKYETRINNLKAQLGYARGDGNILQSKEEIDALRAALRNKDREANEARHQAMRNKLELENEKNRRGGSRACGDEARCQILIGKLEREKEVLLKSHRDNDAMVQQAAREFGKSEEEARHVTVRSYLQELTQAMVAQIAAGGLGKVKDQPVFANILNNMDKIRLRELEAYKNRLEDEVEGLGGNLQFIKMGLVVRLPPNKALHYEDLESGPFEVYLRLCGAVKLFTDVFVKEFGPNAVLPWNHERPRNEICNRRIHIQVLDLFDQQLKVVKNMKYKQYERLIHSLLHQEIARLFNRLIDLKREAVENKKHVLSQMSIQLLEGKSKEITGTTHAALGFMSDQREIEKTTTPLTDPIMGIAADLRYKIWIAMQEAIDHLQQALLSFNTLIPPWRIPEDIAPQSHLPTKTFPDLVTRVLKFEINLLDDRITQLLTYMEKERLPGTIAGQPRLAGPPKYQADWDALTASITFAKLCKGHWWDQLYPDQIQRPRLPLDHPPLLHAVRRETGDILIPNVNPFPWKLQIDGYLQDARIINPPPPQNPNLELNSQILLNPNIQAVKYSIPPVDPSELEVLQDEHGNIIFGDFETERMWYEKYYERKKQLLNWIKASGRSVPFHVGIWTHGAEGPNMGLMRAKKRELVEGVRDLTGWMGEVGIGVPEWPYKGGRMEPDVAMVGT